MRARMLVVGLVTVLAGCGGSGGENGSAGHAQADAEGANYQAQVAALPEGQRNAVFVRAIRDARLDCQHVERSIPAGEHAGMPLWNVRCSGGGNWTVAIQPDGVAQILDADAARPAGDAAADRAGAQ